MILIQLSSAYNPGDTDPGRTYPHAKIAAYHIYPDSNHIQVYPQYGSGNLSSSYWNPGSVFLGSKDISDSEYTALISSASLVGELPFVASDRILHKWLIDSGHVSGTLLTGTL